MLTTLGTVLAFGLTAVFSILGFALYKVLFAEDLDIKKIDGSMFNLR